MCWHVSCLKDYPEAGPFNRLTGTVPVLGTLATTRNDGKKEAPMAKKATKKATKATKKSAPKKAKKKATKKKK